MPEGEKPSNRPIGKSSRIDVDAPEEGMLSAVEMTKRGGLKGFIPLSTPPEGNSDTMPVKNVTTGEMEQIPGLGFSREQKTKVETQAQVKPDASPNPPSTKTNSPTK